MLDSCGRVPQRREVERLQIEASEVAEVEVDGFAQKQVRVSLGYRQLQRRLGLRRCSAGATGAAARPVVSFDFHFSPSSFIYFLFIIVSDFEGKKGVSFVQIFFANFNFKTNYNRARKLSLKER